MMRMMRMTEDLRQMAGGSTQSQQRKQRVASLEHASEPTNKNDCWWARFRSSAPIP
jgi:hypothetical protein